MGHYEIAKMLINAKANVNIPDNQGNSCLTLAVIMEHMDIVKALIKAKADIDSKDDINRTALFIATEEGQKLYVKLLLKNRADPTIPNIKGETARDVALASNKQEILQMLETEIKKRLDVKNKVNDHYLDKNKAKQVINIDNNCIKYNDNNNDDYNDEKSNDNAKKR
eukprot:TRINITY_DN7469_c0_g1_i1.p1 TRINITY_DN7469_c0_g1~~TRINITY_DN7469_c0_g1_i1.p1  ORF type:complete len:167 (-),score=43.79 TRINITY_DN7469_c0_g1_i1:293-793(-)